MSKVRVLLVDDHMVVRVGLKALIDAETDLTVVGEAGNGAEGVAKAIALTPDVIVMDISMPEMDGLEATRRIRQECPQCHVLILTVHAQERYLFPVLKAGAAGYVLKSTVDTELIDAIRIVARGEAFLYPSATRMVLEDYLGQPACGLSRRLRHVERTGTRGAKADRLGLYRPPGRREACPQHQDRRNLSRPHHGEAQPQQPRRPRAVCAQPRAALRISVAFYRASPRCAVQPV